ncbi:MAG TPA: 30S ribosomal protein S20 [Verrucomicrobia bacterium]|nr:30S ribosomal protein S20 [Verrucomicrobiota bacterium]
MPNIKSAEKRQRQAIASTLQNKSKKTRIATAKRDLEDAIQNGDTTKAQTAYSTFCSTLDKGAKAGVIKANNADRRKSRAAKAMTKLKA